PHSPCSSPTLTSSLASCFFRSPAPAPTALYTLSLHDALPICLRRRPVGRLLARDHHVGLEHHAFEQHAVLVELVEHAIEHLIGRSEEHTSELQSPYDLVCRLLLEKKNCRECWYKRGAYTTCDR